MSTIRSDEKVKEERLSIRISGARAGNHRDASMAAALIHLYPDVSRRLGVNSQYTSLLLQALLSEDGELIVCIAEELVKGNYLAADGNMAKRFFDRARLLSPLMGSYVLGGLLAATDGKHAMKILSEAQKAGHIPSMIKKHRILVKRIPYLGRVIGLPLGIHDFIVIWAAVHRGQRINERFWRYRDVFPTPVEPVDKILGASDRSNIFDAVNAL